MIRATLVLLTCGALLGVAAGLAVGLGGFLLAVASYVGAALLLAVPVTGLVVALGRVLDYRLADRAHARLVGYELRRLDVQRSRTLPDHIVDSTAKVWRRD